MKLHIHPYLVYDDEEAFSGTWKVYFAAGYREVSGDIIQLQNTSITPSHGVIFKRVLEASDSFVINTAALPSNKQVTFELHLIQPSTAVTFTLPSSLLWPNGDEFSSTNPPPAMDTADTLYCIVIRWDGDDLLANLAYRKAIEVSA